MTPSPLPRSRKITQEIEGPEAFGGWLWIVVIRQWLLIFWAVSTLEGVISNGLAAGAVLFFGFWLCLVSGTTWLMHKRRRVFVWIYLVQVFVEFLLLSQGSPDTAIYGYGIGALILACYVVLSERSQTTFTRTMEEPTR